MNNPILKIKPYTLSVPTIYPYANGIIWTCNSLFRNCTEAPLSCDLVYVYDETSVDESGNTVTLNIVSEALQHFDMMIPDTVLHNWGADDTIIDDFVLTFDNNFQRQ